MNARYRFSPPRECFVFALWIAGCSEPGEGASQGGSEASSTGGGTTGPSTGATSESEPMCGQCPQERPYCVADVCSDCGGLLAAGRTCAELDLDAPVCDPGTGLCRGCNEHVECPASACELDRGNCFPDDDTAVVYARPEPGAVDCAGRDCSADAPCCTVQEALLTGIDTDRTYVIVHFAGSEPGPVRFVEPLRRVAVLGEPGSSLTHGGDADAPLTVDSVDGRLYVAGVRIEDGAGAPGAYCGRSALWLDDVTIRGRSTDVGIRVDAGCESTLRRARVIDNSVGIAGEFESRIRIENSFIGGSGVTALGANGARVEVLYSTIASEVGFGGALLVCASDSVVRIRNSALLDSMEDPVHGSLSCPGLAPEHVSNSAVTDPRFAGQSGTKAIDAAAVQGLFPGWNTGDYHVAGDGGPLAGIAVWREGDPRGDIDGDPRPAVDGAVEVAGADAPSP